MASQTGKMHGRDECCPRCMSFDVIREDEFTNQFECLDCDHIFMGTISVLSKAQKRAAREKEAARRKHIREKKQKEKEDLINRYKTLKIMINNAKTLQHVQQKHESFFEIDKEFAILCPKKYNSYTKLGLFQKNLKNAYYFHYLNNRLNKMIRDIDRILFYFDK